MVATHAGAAAPPKKKQLLQRPSRRARSGTKAWARAADVADIERAIEAVRDDTRVLGAAPALRPDHALFTLDTAGDAATAAARPAPPRLRVRASGGLVIDRIITPTSGFPAKPQLPRKKSTVVVRGASTGGGKLRLTSKAQLRKIDAIAKNIATRPRNNNSDVKKPKSSTTSINVAVDVWGQSSDPVVGEDSADPNDYLAHLKPRNIKVRTTPSLFIIFAAYCDQKPDLPDTRPSSVPAVKVSHSGASYNPSFSDHQKLLQAALDVELEKERVSKAVKDRLSYPPELDQLEGDGFVDSDSDSDAEDVGDPNAEDGRTGAKKVLPRKKTRTERNKEAALREKEKQLALRKSQEKILNQVTRLSAIEKQIAAGTGKSGKKRRHADADDDKESQKGKPARLGPFLAQPLPLEIKLTDELPSSLMKLKPEGNMFKDRFQSLIERSIIEPRVPQGKKQRYKKKEKERHDYKRFDAETFANL
ncbi:Glioma tumor suppressor candidate region protein 2 [Entophlyctis luteolus]|nr:Glioma tumor suppressor candidate region protein 2 [Entophlyctis luteolus]